MLKRNCGNCIYWSPNKKDHAKCKGCGTDSKSTERPNFMPRDMECPFCDCAMIYNKRDLFLRCGDCGTEIWPFLHGGTTKQVVREEFEKNLPCSRNTTVSSVIMHTKGIKSSSKSKGSNKKALMQKKSTTQLYKELAK
jgi:hypothetical protein